LLAYIGKRNDVSTAAAAAAAAVAAQRWRV